MIIKLCQVCEAEPAKESCQKCGRLMGKNCKKDILCKECRQGALGRLPISRNIN